MFSRAFIIVAVLSALSCGTIELSAQISTDETVRDQNAIEIVDRKIPLLIDWTTRIGGPADDSLNGLAAWPGGGFVATGFTQVAQDGNRDLWVVRYLSDGTELWQRTFGTDRTDEGNAVAVLPNGEMAVTGLTTRKRFWEDLWILKLDRKGNKQWDRHIGSWDEEVGRAIQAMPYGGFLVAGDTISKGLGGFDAWLIHVDPSGNTVWERTLGGSLDESVRAVAVLAEGGLIVAGETGSREANQWDAWVARLEGKGYQIWGWSAGGERQDRAYAIAALPWGEFVMAGETRSQGAGGSDAWLVKLDAKGQVAWERTVGTARDESARAVIALPDGGILAVGHSQGEKDNTRPWLAKISPDGEVIWQYVLGGGDDITVRAATLIKPGDLLLAGSISSTDSQGTDGWLAKLTLLPQMALGGGNDTASEPAGGAQ